MVTKQKIFIKFRVSETLKGVPNTLQNLMFIQLRVDEIVGGGGGGGGGSRDSLPLLKSVGPK